MGLVGLGLHLARNASVSAQNISTYSYASQRHETWRDEETREDRAN